MVTEAAGHPITCARFSDEVMAGHPFLAKLTHLLDERLAGKSDLDALRKLKPDLQSFRSWLAGDGRKAFRAAVGTAGTWAYGHA